MNNKNVHLTAKAKGVAVITASSGELSATCVISVDGISTDVTDVIEENSDEVVVYNLKGIRMEINSREELKRLSSGFYIVNDHIELIK